ncbi:hypothetical protein [Kordia sp.]|uniref:hypothetical protein n=1 Tax=Kordia sp. TaxID=1965332 RepID=UPI003D6AD349
MKKLKSISEFSKNAKMKKLNFSDMIYGGRAGGYTLTGCKSSGGNLHDCSDTDTGSTTPAEPADSTPVA